jgi:hypothetical protein
MERKQGGGMERYKAKSKSDPSKFKYFTSSGFKVGDTVAFKWHKEVGMVNNVITIDLDKHPQICVVCRKRLDISKKNYGFHFTDSGAWERCSYKNMPVQWQSKPIKIKPCKFCKIDLHALTCKQKPSKRLLKKTLSKIMRKVGEERK